VLATFAARPPARFALRRARGSRFPVPRSCSLRSRFPVPSSRFCRACGAAVRGSRFGVLGSGFSVWGSCPPDNSKCIGANLER